MELEVGVTITRDTGDLTFASTETEAVFILAAHLPGFTKDEIEVAMNEGDSQISIRGGGHIAFQEAVIASRVAITREVSTECFDESFPVPGTVDLDGIDAWFDEEEKILIISIPKLLTNDSSWIGEEETAEHPIQEERQVCTELIPGETQEPTEEKNEESELQGLTRPHKAKKQQAPAEIPHLPPMPGELIRHSPAEEQLQTGAADVDNKTAALPQHPESEYSQMMQVAAQRLDQEEQDDEAAREHRTPKLKRPMQREAKMTALEDDFNASEKVCAAPTEFKKQTERTETETPRIAEYSGSEEPNIEFNPSKEEAQEHWIPSIDKPHETPEQCPEQKQEQKMHEEHEIPTMKPMDVEHVAMVSPKPRESCHVVKVQQKCKTLDATETENSELPKVKGTAQQLYPQKEEEQNQKKPRVKEPDQMQETKQLIESKNEYEDIKTEKYREIKREKSEVETTDEVLEAELFETKKEEKELPKEKDEGKLNGGPAYEKPISAEWPETRKPEIELQGTKEDEKPKLTGTEREKRSSFETKDESQDDHRKEEKIKQCLEKPTEKPSLLIKEEAKQQKSKEKEEKEMHQPEEEWSQGKKNHTEELPHDKPKTEKLPEPRVLHQKDGRPQLEITDQVKETKHLTKSRETEDEIQKQEQEHEKPATVQKDKKSKDVGLPDKELRSIHKFKDDEAGQLKGPDIEAFRVREQLKPKEFSLDLHKQKTEKPTLKAPKEMREAAEPTKTEKERQPEEQEVHEQKTPIGLSREKTRTMKFKGPKELGQKHEQDRVSAPEQVLEEAAEDIQSETEEELKQYEHEGQEDTEPIVVPACEKPKAAELPQTEEPKPWVYEFYEDEDHQWIGPDREASKTRISLELEEKYKNLQQEEEIIKQKAEKPTEKAQKQHHKVVESTKSDGEKEAKKEAEQIEEQEAPEYKKSIIQPTHEEVSARKLSGPNKTVQAHEKVGVKELDEILEAARHIQSVDMEELQHEDEVQEHEKFMVVPTYEKPEATGLIKKEELKSALRVLKEDEEDRLKVADISTPKIRQSQYLHEEQVKNKQKTEKTSVKAPRQVLTVEKPAKLEEKEAKQQTEKPEEQEPSEHRKSTVHPPYEKHDSKHSAESKKADKTHKPKVRELVQVLEAAEDQPEEQEGLKQQEQEVQEQEKAIVVPACEKPHVKTPNQVLEVEEHFQSEQFEKVYQQDDQELQKQEIPTVMPTSKKPKASECAKKKAPKPQIYELQECKNHQWMGPNIDKSPNKKSFKLGEESQLTQQEQEIVKQKAEKPKTKRLVEAIESTQSEEEKEKEHGLDQSKEKDVERGKMSRMTTYEENIEQEFQISVEGHDHKIIGESQEPEKQEEPILDESTTLEKDSKPMLELALGAPYQTPDIIDIRPQEELALPTPKAPKTKGVPKRQESSRKKESKEFEKSIAGPAFKAPKLKEFTSIEEQKHDLPELKERIHGFKEDEDHQLKDTNREALETRDSMKPKELPLHLQKLKTEKPTLKAPKDMSKAADLIKTEREEKVETKLHKPEEQETQEQKMPLELPHEKARTMKFQEQKEPGQKHEKTRVSELEQVLEAAPHIQSKQDEEFKPYEHRMQTDKEPIQVPAFEKTKAAELPQKEEPKRKVHEFHEDEDHKRMGPESQVSKTRMPLELEKNYKDYQQKEVMKQNAEKPIEKACKQLLQVAEFTEQQEMEAKKELQQPEEQETQEYKKPIKQPSHEEASAMKLPKPKKTVQVHEQLEVKTTDQILEDVQHIQSEYIKKELKQHQDEVQKHEEFALAPIYKKPEAAGLIENEELKPALNVIKEGPDNQQKKSDLGTPKIREFQYFLQEQTKKKQKTEKPSVKAPRQSFDKTQGQDRSEYRKPTLCSPYETHNTAQSAKQKEANEEQRSKVRTLVQMLETAQAQSEEQEQALKQQEQKVQEHEKPVVVPTSKTPQITPSNQVQEDEEYFQPEKLEKESEQHEQDLKKQGKPAVGPTCEKPKAAEYAIKEEPKQQICELQEDKKQLLQQEQVIMKPKAEKPTKKVQKRFEETTEAAQSEDEEKEAKQEPDQPKEQEAQRRKTRGMPTYEEELEQELQISAEEGHDHEPEKQEETLSKEPTPSEKESKPMLEHIEPKEHQKPAVEAPYQTPDMIDFKTPEELALTTPMAPKIKEVSKRQEKYDKKESKIFEKPATKPSFKAPKIKEFRSLEEQKQELQAQKKIDENKSPERHQSKEKVERPREKQSVMPTYNEEMEKQIQQLADEESFEHEIILKSPEKFTKLTKPAKEVPKLMLVKEVEESETPKRKLLQPEKKAAPASQGFSTLKEPETKAALETKEPERNQQSKYQKFAEDPSYQASEITKFIGPEKQELQEKEATVHKILEPGTTKKKEEQQREQLDRKPKKWDETTLLESEAEKYKIPIAESLEIKGIPESHEPYTKPGEYLHVKADLQLKPPGETKAQETTCSSVGAQLPGKPTVGPSERESQTKQVEQATDFSIPRIQPTENKQTKEHEGPRLPLFMEDESKDLLEQQFKQPDEEEAQKRASPPKQDLARKGATLEPPDRAACTNVVVETVMEQKLYRAEQGEHQQDIKSPKSQKPPPLPSELEGGEVPEHDETTLEPPKPLPRVRGTMETGGSPPLLTMEKEATKPTITPPKMRGAIEPEESLLLPSHGEETMEREFPTLIQKELHPGSDLQNAEDQKTASRQLPEFEESAEEQEGKTKEQPPPHRAQEEIQRPTDNELHKISELPQPMKICERESKIYAPKELEEEQELNPPLPLDHDKITLEEEVSTDEVEASCVEMDKSKKVKKLSRRRSFHCRCRGRRPAYPIPPSTLLSGSAFVFSIMVLVFHFIRRKKPN